MDLSVERGMDIVMMQPCFGICAVRVGTPKVIVLDMEWYRRVAPAVSLPSIDKVIYFYHPNDLPHGNIDAPTPPRRPQHIPRS